MKASIFVVIASLIVQSLTHVAQSQSAETPGDRGRTVQHWVVDTAPTLEVRMKDTLNFSLIVGLSLLPDGGIVIASDIANNLQYFNRNGTYVRSVGRMGRGPGEFQGIGSFHRFGDSLAVVDLQGVLQIFTVTGKYIRTAPPLMNKSRTLGFFADGRLIAGSLDYTSLEAGKWQQATELLQVWRGSDARTLGRFPSVLAFRGKEGSVKGNVYSPRNRVAVLANHFCAGFAGSTSINCYDAGGRDRSSFRLSGRADVAVTKADEEAYFQDIYDANVGEPKAKLDAQERAARARVTFSKSMGYFGDLIASRDNSLWVGPPSNKDGRPFAQNALPDKPTQWDIYDLSGSALAVVELPARFRLMEAGANYVAGVTADHDGLEVVRVLRLTKK
jgi:hypothetical protein